MPREDADTIEECKTDLGTHWKQNMISRHLEHKIAFKSEFDVILQALVIGFEVEQTPEDKVRELYEKASNKKSEIYHRSAVDFDEVELQNGIMQGIEAILKIYNIKISGVNDQ